MYIKYLDNCQWENIALLPYKDGGTHYKSITKQILFEGLDDIPCQLRYFEIAPEGYSTLEHHQHAHLVIILSGEGEVLLGDRVFPVREKDIISIPAHTWHQFRATKGEVFGFLCLVNVERDKPVLPAEDDLALLRRDPVIAAFIRS